jgi:hypothetical protein
MMKPFQNCKMVALAFVLAATACDACAAPKTVKATYNAFMNGVSIGTITEQFEAGAGQYRIVSDTKPLGLATLIQRQPLRFSSTGRVARDGLRPKQFEARRTPTDKAEVVAEFDWDQGQLVLTQNGKSESVTLPAGTQDRLSVMYQFMYLSPERLRELHFPMTNGRKLDTYRYQLTQDGEVETGLGRLKALHLVKIREPGETVNEVWLSPQHHYLPVKMTIIERDGMRFEQVIQNLELRE